MKYWVSLAVLLVISNISAENIGPICEICQCNTDFSVACTENVRHILYLNSTWMKNENDTNSKYHYEKVLITNNVLTDLDKLFPTSNLFYLSLSRNEIATISAGVFQNLENMTVLDLSYNFLDVIKPDAFRGVYQPGRLMPLIALKELYLDNNNIHSLDQDLFEHVRRLEVLSLNHNPLFTIDNHATVAITNLYNLLHLDLSYTSIKTLPDSFLHGPSKLAILDLSGNPIAEVPKTFGDAKSLHTLYLNATAFVSITKENGFPPMPSLEVLHICRTEELANITAHAFAGLSSLKQLSITDNIKLTSIDPFTLAAANEANVEIWPTLETLRLQNNKLAYLDRDFLAHWDSLHYLDLRDNPWTCECENRWLVETLMPIYERINVSMAREIKCAAPIEMIKFTLYNLYQEEREMRCLDIYGAQPEKDAALLIGILCGVLIGIPLVLFLIFAYQRNFFGLCDKSPAAYSRRFYSSQISNDDYF